MVPRNEFYSIVFVVVVNDIPPTAAASPAQEMTSADGLVGFARRMEYIQWRYQAGI